MGTVRIAGHGDDLCEVEAVDPVLGTIPGCDEYSNTDGEFIMLVITRDMSEDGPIGAVRLKVAFGDDWTITPSAVPGFPHPTVLVSGHNAVIDDVLLVVREAERDG